MFGGLRRKPAVASWQPTPSKSKKANRISIDGDAEGLPSYRYSRHFGIKKKAVKSGKKKNPRTRLRDHRDKNRSYMRKGRLITDCAPLHGSQLYEDGTNTYMATRGTRAQVMHNMAHHTCSGNKYTKNMFKKRGSRIVLKHRSDIAKWRWAAMAPEHKALMRSFQFRSGPKRKDGKGTSVRTDPHFVKQYRKGSTKFTRSAAPKRGLKAQKKYPIGTPEADIFDEDSDNDLPPAVSGRSSRTRANPSRFVSY